MKYIDRSKEATPANLNGQAPPTSGDAIDSDIYGHVDVKTALNNLQKGICCYCESRYDVTSYGDVEHFRPKNGWKQDKDDKELHQPGYYWLAYKWENLMYACELCNRTYKRNYFPLKYPSKRFDPADKDISGEEPLLINPYEEKHPENHLKFVGAEIQALTKEGDASIFYYGLDRERLNEERRGVINTIYSLIDIAELVQGTAKEQEAIKKVKDCIKDKLEEGQHTLMIKWNFGELL